MMSDALLDDDMQTNDLFLYAIVFVIVVGAITFVAMSIGLTFGATVLVPAMVVGFFAVAALATRLANKRHARDAALRTDRQKNEDADRARKIADMKRERFEKGL